ncbi:HmuY family protein [Limibacter armeniacum]|uniref:HmuY family protein n=1 Tax=Limibacter armeniacum TaxID=466084 RepID=UPI002FE5FFDB
MKKFYFIALAFLGFACSEEDTAPELSYDRNIMQVELDTGYSTQVFIDFDLDQNNTVSVSKTESNYTTFDFSEETTVEANILDSWDVVFTQYHILIPMGEGEYYPYDVTGALVNTLGGAKAVAINDTNFETLTLEEAMTLELTDDMQSIGYNWKQLDFATYKYAMVENMYYVIKTEKGEFLKLRFIDFYNENGDKGYPAFEYQRLQ